MIKVLLIDDDDGMRDMLRLMLQSLRLHVIEAANGVAGLALFRTHQPNLVITDIMMPEKDGIETMREIRMIDPQARIIAISGGAGDKYPDVFALAKELGAADALEKPIRREQFLGTVSRVLSGVA
jgi:CheY-like chemotaxis protein